MHAIFYGQDSIVEQPYIFLHKIAMSGADVTITFASAALTAGETYAITTPADRYTSATSKAKNEEITISFTTVNILHVTALSEILSIAGADDNLIVYKQ